MVTPRLRLHQQSTSLLIQLLLRNPQVRLGVNGIEEVRNHPWLADV